MAILLLACIYTIRQRILRPLFSDRIVFGISSHCMNHIQTLILLSLLKRPGSSEQKNKDFSDYNNDWY
jgi:hypothetical protein